MRLADFTALSFDCYGTLIDWETGLLAALAPLLERARAAGRPIAGAAALAAFAELESAVEADHPTMPYPRVLAEVHAALAARWQVALPAEAHRRFGASIADWPPFADSTAALSYLGEHYRLVILSNVDRASFAASNQRLGVAFDAVYTAEDIGSYKPAAANFEFLIRRARADLGIERDGLLHTAQSLFHDHEPAKRLGLATAWIDRRHDRDGWGATRPPAGAPTPDFYFHTLGEMAAAHRAEAGV